MMPRQYAVCSSCAVILSNADDSHIGPADLDRITATVESIGLVVHVETESNDGYWNCDICDELICGGQSEIYETL